MNYFKSQNAAAIGLDAVEEQVETYRRRGFQDHKQRVVCFERQPLLDSFSTKPDDMRNIRESNIEALVDFDHYFSGLQRPALWKALLQDPDVEGWTIQHKGQLLSLIHI